MESFELPRRGRTLCITCLLIVVLQGCAASKPSPVEERPSRGASTSKAAPAVVTPPAPPAAPTQPQDPVDACLGQGGSWVTPVAGTGGTGHCDMPKRQQ
jgi:hypothetical protein